MIKKLPAIIFLLIIFLVIGWFVYLLTTIDLHVLNPKGVISAKESYIITFSLGFMLLIAIPVVITGYAVAWKYRSTKKSKYLSEWTGNIYIKGIYWIFFVSIALFFFAVIWLTAHDLSPYKPIPSSNKEIVIQVVALNWKWLFIYPEENIATVNFIQIPIDTPVRFELTADAPMNSFWIPQLSGQIYSMTSMETKIHMIGNRLGDFTGRAAEINGKGFSGMTFVTRVSSFKDYENWLKSVKDSSMPLNKMTYENLSLQSEYNPVVYYSPVEKGLYDDIMTKYMMPPDLDEDSMSMEGEN